MEQPVVPEKDVAVPGVGLSGKERRLVLHGGCLELLHWCEAMCCRGWDVSLSPEEYQSGTYDAEPVCLHFKKLCQSKLSACASRRLRLKKKSDGSCGHLDVNRCSIYDNRPEVCRKFTCKAGWRLDRVFPSEDPPGIPAATLGKDQFMAGLTDETTFVPHPLLSFVTLLYSKEKQTVVFVVKLLGAPEELRIVESFSNPNLRRQDLLDLIGLFSNKDSLLEVRRRFDASHTRGLQKQEFDEVVWLLSKSKIIVSAEVLRGML